VIGPSWETIDVNIKAIIETAIYVDDLNATEAFYRTVLGLTVIAKEPGHHVFFQVGDASVLLAFIADTTLKGNPLPPHGAKGPGHFALGIESDALDVWRRKLQESRVAIEQEVEWPRGGKSIYFRDPAGNLVELIRPEYGDCRAGGETSLTVGPECLLRGMFSCPNIFCPTGSQRLQSGFGKETAARTSFIRQVINTTE
jgi:catechol 2,3-dioxygenase-like lactoylglutathione lyase family enzyme